MPASGAAGHGVGGVAHDDVAERGLARAVGTHEDVALARTHGQVDAVQDGLVLGARREGAHVEKLVCHVVPFSRGRGARVPVVSLIHTNKWGIKGKRQARKTAEW